MKDFSLIWVKNYANIYVENAGGHVNIAVLGKWPFGCKT